MTAGSDWSSSRALLTLKTVAEAMDLKLDADNPADREILTATARDIAKTAAY